MIDRDNVLPLTRQVGLLRLSRSSAYYLPRPAPPARLAIMRRIDELHLEHPFAGSRMLRDLLRREGLTIGRLAVATLMRRMSIEALYRRPNTSKPAPGHKIYPYRLHPVTQEPKGRDSARRDTLPAALQDREHVRQAQGLATHPHPLRPMPPHLHVRYRHRRNRHFLAMTQ